MSSAPITVLNADAVSLAQSILTGVLPSPVEGQVPNPRPARFTVVRLNGGYQQSAVSFVARLLIESWATTAEQAHADAQLCLATLRAARGSVVDGVTVTTVESVGGPTNFPDPLANVPRFTQLINFATRGADL